MKLNLLQKYIFIALDVFCEISYTIDEELNAWLLFLSSDKPGELIGMYSEALEIMDSNTVQYMIEEKGAEIECGMKD